MSYIPTVEEAHTAKEAVQNALLELKDWHEIRDSRNLPPHEQPCAICIIFDLVKGYPKIKDLLPFEETHAQAD